MCVRVIRRRKRTTLPPDNKAVFISGCDSGFGYMVAQRLDKKGYKVFAGCLHPEKEGAVSLRSSCSENLHVLQLDVTSDDSVKAAGQYVQHHLGETKLWAVVNNAGIYGHGDAELCAIETYKKVAEVNFYGLLRVTQEFLPLIRQSQGRIVNMSSMSGRNPWPSSSAYNCSKFSVECLSDCLRIEMVKFGVKVALVEPAMFGGSTNIHSTDNIKRSYEDIDRHWEKCDDNVKSTYSKQYLRDQIDVLLHFRQSLNAKSPDPVIDAVEDGVSSSHPQYRYVVHGGPFPVDPMVIIGLVYPYIPESVSDWLIARVTGHHNMDSLKGMAKPVSQRSSKDAKAD